MNEMQIYVYRAISGKEKAARTVFGLNVARIIFNLYIVSQQYAVQ